MKKIIIFCLLFFCKYSFGDSNFVIQKIHTDNIYYNVVIYENEVYVSSNHGIFLIDSSSGKLVMHDKSVEGIINSDLSKNLSFKIEFIDSPIPLPDSYMSTVTDFAYHHNSLYVVTKETYLNTKTNPINFLHTEVFVLSLKIVLERIAEYILMEINLKKQTIPMDK